MQRSRVVPFMAGGDGRGGSGVLDRLLEEYAASTGRTLGGTRATPSTPSQPYYTGPGGLFGAPGTEKDVISTRIQPFGLASALPARATLNMYPLYAFLTGFQDDVGSEANGPCDDPPTVGAGKSCLQTAQFGRYSRQTRTFEINRVGQFNDRSEEALDLRFFNDPLVSGGNDLTVPSSSPRAAGLRREVLMRMLEVGVSFQEILSRQVYEGNPSNNTGAGGFKEFPGLDILIGTGKVDALTNTACPSLDSLIRNASYRRVDGSGNYYIEQLTYMMRYLRFNADHMNMGQTEWAFVMRPSLFYELTSIWPCAYYTYRCQTSSGNEGIVDAAEMIRMRDDMRNGMYLMMDGKRIRVIEDTSIREETNTQTGAVASGCFASDIYIVPLTVRGGVAVTYWEYLDYTRGAMVGVEDARLAPGYFWTDGGRYLWHAKPPQNWCVQLMAKIEPRLILRTPHLAARLQNIMYCPLIHERDSDRSDPYFVDGGVQGPRAAPSYYNEW